MALATRCPNCSTTFRVVADQLKLRGGLVRCGNCRHVFDAITSITYVEDAATRDEVNAATRAAAGERVGPTRRPSRLSSPAPEAADRPAAARREQDAPRPLERPDAAGLPAAKAPILPVAVATPPPAAPPPPSPPSPPPGPPVAPPPAAAPAASPAPASAAPSRDDDRASPASRTENAGSAPLPPAVSKTLVEARTAGTDAANIAQGPTPSIESRRVDSREPVFDFGDRDVGGPTSDAMGAAGQAAPLTLNTTIDRPLDDEDGGLAAEESPEFLREPTLREKGFSVFFGGGAALLAIVFVSQLAVILRSELVARWPAVRPALAGLCHAYGCSVGWPTRADMLAVVGTDLQSVPGTDVLELTAVVRNRADFRIALPSIELTLTDVSGRAVARKVFAPADYLASGGGSAARIDEGLEAGADISIRITFEARGVTAVGFVVYPFFI